MAKLVLSADACGARGQLSLLTDYFEWCAIVRQLELNAKLLADFLIDRQLRVPAFMYVPLHQRADDATEEATDEQLPQDHAAAEDVRRRRANEDANRVLRLCQERAHYLGDAYPYSVDGSRLIRREKRVTTYDVVLAMTLRHTCGQDQQVAYEFEDFVARCMKARSFRTFAMADQIRKAPGAGAERFRKMYVSLANSLRLGIDATATIPAHIHDGGADVLARWEPFDDRPGCRTILVQATVGPVETWDRKAQQKKTMWSRILGDPLLPLVTLAVPHHVERQYLNTIVEEGDGATILDRLRLVAHKPTTTSQEKKRVAALRNRGVDW